MLIPALWSCEDTIYPELESTEAGIVVDAWITSEAQPQVVRLTETLPYYTNAFTPGITDAIVYIIEDETERYDFPSSNVAGSYEWSPSASQPVLGKIGSNYQLIIEYNGITLTSFSQLNRVPPIDSVIFTYEDDGFVSESYFAQFYARDPEGNGDAYWIKAYKNGNFLNKPSEISLAFDAGPSAGSDIDGLIFIQPIRQSINAFETDENDEFISPYAPGDSVEVELHSITTDAFFFLTELQIQTDRPGGFAELFAVPLSNIPTNISSTSGRPILGFFNMSAVSRGSGYLDPNDLPTE
jgi:hypothetical protein